MTWQAGEFHAMTPNGARSGAGWVKGLFALDFRPLDNCHDGDLSVVVGWQLTHLPTGYGVIGLLMGLEDAKAVADEVAAWADWEHVNPDTARFMSGKMRALRKRLGPTHCRSDDMVPPWSVTEFELVPSPPKLTVVE